MKNGKNRKQRVGSEVTDRVWVPVKLCSSFLLPVALLAPRSSFLVPCFSSIRKSSLKRIIIVFGRKIPESYHSPETSLHSSQSIALSIFLANVEIRVDTRFLEIILFGVLFVGDATEGAERSERQGKTYTCDECNAIFTKYTSLKSHLLKHSGEKKYKCDHCTKTFFSSSSLKIHVRVHTGDRPFKCKECPRKFSDPSNFNKHKRWHAKQKASNAGSTTLSSISENSSSPENKEKEVTEAEQSSSGVAEDEAVIGEGNEAEVEQPDVEGGAKDDLKEDLFPEASQDMEVEESGGFKSPEALLNMEGTVKQEVETD